jgi:hypothetical protein
MTLVQIVPRLPPATDGLGDYALSLARELRADFGIDSRFIVCDTTWTGHDRIEGFSTERLTARSAANLTSMLNSSNGFGAVLLHYVGYGYAKRGAPAWLIDALENWRRHSGGSRLLTMFHEIYATGPIWTSAFWLSSKQKQLAARLARLSDACLTSRQGYAEIINALSRNKHASIAALPVFSNIGEPEQRPCPLNERQCQLVIFGGASNRARVYKNSLAVLERVCRALDVERIIDVGPPTGLGGGRINGIPLVQMGRKSAAEVSALLSDSIAGFFDYHTAYLAKSTIFAAYSAHRLIPISAGCDGAQVDGLEAGRHYWTADSDRAILNLTAGQEIADNAYDWYQSHRLSEHVKRFVAEITRIKRFELEPDMAEPSHQRRANSRDSSLSKHNSHIA